MAAAMNYRFLGRLALVFTAAGLLLMALAYWWLDNTSHELIGTGFFLLLIGHNVINRWWYGRIKHSGRRPPGAFRVAVNLTLLVTMLTLLVSSIVVSHTVFGFLGFNQGYTAREVHVVAAHWALVIVAVHLGMHWSMIMGFVRSRLGLKTAPARTVVLRLLAGAIAVCGLYSWSVANITSKLFLQYTMDFWDFSTDVPWFFAHHTAVIGLCGVIGHYALTLAQLQKTTATARPSPLGAE